MTQKEANILYTKAKNTSGSVEALGFNTDIFQM